MLNCWGFSQMLNSAVAFVLLVGGLFVHAPEPVGTTALRFVSRSRVFSSRHKGMGGHNRW